MKKTIISAVVSTLLLNSSINAKDINIEKGWQLKGSSTDISLDTFNKDANCIDTVWTYDKSIKSWKAYSPDIDTMDKIDNTLTVNKLENINPYDGFWINANEDCNITFEDIETPVVDDDIEVPVNEESNLTILSSNKIGVEGDDEIVDIEFDSEGNYIITGTLYGKVEGGDTFGQQDPFVAKYSQDGELKWIEQIGGNLQDFGRNIAIDSNDNVYSLVDSSSDSFNSVNLNSYTTAFLIKYDKYGNKKWVKAISTDDDISLYGKSLEIDSEDDIYVIGNLQDPLNGKVTKGGSDIYVVKYEDNTTSDSKPLWTKIFGSEDDEEFKSSTIDESDNIYIVGTTKSENLTNESTSNKDGIIYKIDKDGIEKNIKVIGGDSDTLLTSIDYYNDNLYLTGYSKSNFENYTGIDNNSSVYNTFVSSLSSSLDDINWFKVYENSEYLISTGIYTDNSGIYISGDTNSTKLGTYTYNGGDMDGYILRYTTEGELTNQQLVGGDGYDIIDSIKKYDDKIYLVGATNSSDFLKIDKSNHKDGFLITID